MRSPDVTDTGLDLDVAGTADELVALVQQAVARSGDAAQTTRHYIAIDGGTSADIRLRVVSVDDPAPLLAFAITTARSARGVAASTFVLQHGVQKRRRQRSLLGEEPFLAFLHELASIVGAADDGSSITLRVHGARTVLSAPQQPEVPQEPAVTGWDEARADAPDAAAARTVQEAPAATAGPEPVPTVPPLPDIASPEPVAAPTASTVSPVPPADGPPRAEPALPAAERSEQTPPSVAEAPVSTPQVRAVPTVIAAPPLSTTASSVAPELQITVPPGLVGFVPRGEDPEASGDTPVQHAAPSVVPARQAEFDATIAAASLRSGDFALELPDGERIPLHRALLIGRNPSSRPEQPDAELRAIVDPRMSVSKTHTAVVPGRRSIRVTDLHSTNGTTVTDAAGAVTVCVPGEAYVVESGSTIGIGEYPIRVITV